VIIFVIFYLPYFGGDLSVFLFTESSVLCPTPFLCGRFRFHLPSLLCMFNYSSLFGFQFCRAIWFWMLLSDPGDQSVIHYLPCFWGVAYCSPELSLHCLSCVYLLRVKHWEFSSLPLPLSLGQVQCATHPLHSPC
jgi:hypothetical protein